MQIRGFDLQFLCCEVAKMHLNPLERGQPKRVATILNTKNAQQKAVHDEDDAAPYQHCGLLRLWILDSGYM